MATLLPWIPLMDTGLDEGIYISEICKALAKAKHGKTVGYDTIPMDVIRNSGAIHLLNRLFNVCFYSRCVSDV